MKLRNVIGSTASKLYNVPPLTGSRLFGINLVRALEDRYGFLQAPKGLEEFDLSRGISFKRGFFARKYNIETVIFYSNGIKVDVPHETNVADDFIEDVVSWLVGEAGIDLVQADPLRIYESALEFEFAADFVANFVRLASLGDTISKFISNYGGPPITYQPTGVTLWSELQSKGPAQFKVERRIDVGFEEKIFFSSAPLSTGDHLLTLEALEGIFG